MGLPSRARATRADLKRLKTFRNGTLHGKLHPRRACLALTTLIMLSISVSSPLSLSLSLSVPPFPPWVERDCGPKMAKYFACPQLPPET